MTAANRQQCVLILSAAVLIGGAGTRVTAQTFSEAIQLQPSAPTFIRTQPGAPTFIQAQPGAPTFIQEKRACDGCPKRSVGKAFFHELIVNVFYGFANLIRGQDTAKVTPKTWWHNMEQGWVWDLDDFGVNQIGHPYQGNNYFNTGRANGLSFYESAALTAFGSATWEFYGETNHASLNDFINTTLGGIALGEMFHRTAWLVRDTRATGKGRLWKEIGAMAIDPITGAERFLTGDSSRLSDKPPDMVPTGLHGLFSGGVLWRGSEGSVADAAGQAFVETDVIYGDPTTGRSRMPYDGFAVRLRMGGGAPLSDVRVRGRLLGQTFKSDKVHFAAVQTYDFQANEAYHTGSQSFEGAFFFRQPLKGEVTMSLFGWAGLTVLGAIDSLPVGETEIPEEEENPEEGDGQQGVSEGPRFYDYGPGGNFGGLVQFSHRDRAFAIVMYEGRHLYSLDGVRANHFLQRARLDFLVPLRGAFGFGATAEYFDRQTFFHDANATRSRFHYPQARLYFTWRKS